MTRQSLKISGGSTRGEIQPAGQDASSEQDDLVAAQRLVKFLARRAERARAGSPFRILDVSPDRPLLIKAMFEFAHEQSLPIVVTTLARSETTRALIEAACPEGAELAVALQSEDDPLEELGGEEYDCVHSALSLLRLRELPRLTMLKKLERLESPLFVWTDHATERKKDILSSAERVDLGFCSYKRPIGSKLFTLTGVREPGGRLTRTARDDSR